MFSTLPDNGRLVSIHKENALKQIRCFRNIAAATEVFID